ncbi:MULTISPECIES: stage V sporulation protein AE [Clostridium]|uniref:stage V sporulation protein AE n=1 Tax=Clostridium TaxID=1485 RepID=UPI00069DF7D0|nr:MULTISPECIES: stage V sporulation protein AE [Clostridium]KOF55943.1 stage V sporulation protein AE [Clostridium sp. DMHC 10]MCD2345341.1 stage V sporulation protein AE [Clostridium guangxiense]
MNRKVIIVTDGDSIAQKVIERAAAKTGCRTLSISSGNPTKITGNEMVRLIECVKNDPVIVMADDRGDTGRGNGEKVIDYLIKSREIDVMGIIAVASNTKNASGIKVNCSINRDGKISENSVDKHGNITMSKVLIGDTVNTINPSSVNYVIGVGDPGKMRCNDDIESECFILTKAINIIISKYDNRKNKIFN